MEDRDLLEMAEENFRQSLGDDPYYAQIRALQSIAASLLVFSRAMTPATIDQVPAITEEE